jgi:hypothetical protein
VDRSHYHKNEININITIAGIKIFLSACKSISEHESYSSCLPVYLFPRSGIWAIQPLGPFLIILFHLPVGRYLVKILSPDFSNDCSIGS